MILKKLRPFVALFGLVTLADIATAQNADEHGPVALRVYYSDLYLALSQYELDEVPFKQKKITAGRNESLLELAKRNRIDELDSFHLAAAIYEANMQQFDNSDTVKLQAGATINMPSVGDIFIAQDRYEKLKVIGDSLDFRNDENQMRNGLRRPFGKSLVMIGPSARDELPRNREVTLSSYRPGAIASVQGAVIQEVDDNDFLSRASRASVTEQVPGSSGSVAINGLSNTGTVATGQTFSRWISLSEESTLVTDRTLLEGAQVQQPGRSQSVELSVAELVPAAAKSAPVAKPVARVVQREAVELGFSDSQLLVESIVTPAGTTQPKDTTESAMVVELPADSQANTKESIEVVELDYSQAVENVQMKPVDVVIPDVVGLDDIVADDSTEVVVPAPKNDIAQASAPLPVEVDSETDTDALAVQDSLPSTGTSQSQSALVLEQNIDSQRSIETAGSTAVASLREPALQPDKSVPELDIGAAIAAAEPLITTGATFKGVGSAGPDVYLGPPRNSQASLAKAASIDPLSDIVEWTFDDGTSVGSVLERLAEYVGYELVSTDEMVLDSYSRRLPARQRSVSGISAEEGFSMLAGRGLETVFDHVSRSVSHIPKGVSVKPLLANAESSGFNAKTHEQFVQVAGISSMLQQFPDDILLAAGRHASRCDSAPVNSQPDAGRLHKVIVDNLQQKTLEPVTRSLVEWYASPTGRKVLKLEKEQMDDAGFQQFVINDGRLDYIRQIYNNTVTGKGITSIAVELDYAGWSLSGCKQKAERSGDVQKMSMELTHGQGIKKKRGKLESVIRDDMLRSLAYQFASLSDSELAEYAEITSINAGVYSELEQSIVDAIEVETKVITVSAAQK